MASKAIPSHLRPQAASGNGSNGAPQQRHHGKSQSHVVSATFPILFPTHLSNAVWMRDEHRHTLLLVHRTDLV